MNAFQKLIFEVVDLRRRLMFSERHGKVAEYKDGLARIEIGKTAEGEPWLTPWLRTNTHMGFRKQDVPLKVGQFVTVRSPYGQVGPQSTIHPASWNDDNKFKDDERADDQVTTQVGKLRFIEKEDSYLIEHTDTHTQVEIGKDGVHVRGRIGTGEDAPRFGAHKDGYAKLRAGGPNLHITIDQAAGQIIFGMEPVIGPDPKPDL